nr:hypothetical protein [Tanacetum cinerariifolium]
MNELLTMMQSCCEKLLQQKQSANIDQPPLQEMSIQEIKDLKQHYLDEMLSLSNNLGIKDYRNEKIDIRFRRKCEDTIDELNVKFNGMSIEIDKKKEFQYLEQVANLYAYSLQQPPSNTITPVLLTLEPEDSLIMGKEKLSTIPEKESDEFIKSSVEDLVPIPSEPEDTFESDCDDVELLLHCDPSTPMMSVVSILEGFIDEPPLEENDDLFDLESKKNDWKKILNDAPTDDLMTEDKVFDPEIHDQIFSLTYASLHFTNHHYLFFTYVVRILLLYFTYPVVSPFLLSSGSEDTIFDPGISAFHFSHWSGTFISFNVYPNILNESPDCPDFEDSRARSFVLRSLEIQPLAYGNLIS